MKLPEDIQRVALLGWHCFPASIVGKSACFKGAPAAATTDLDTLDRWATAFEGCNWRVALGKSGLFVLDVDRPGPTHKHDGFVELTKLTQRYRPLPPRPMTKTGGSGGAALFFRHQDEPLIGASGKPFPGIDPHRLGQVIVIPPSRHPKTGGTYSWRIPPWEVSPPPVPDWLAQLYAPKPEPKWKQHPFNPTSERARNALMRAIHKIADASPGAANDTLNKQSFWLGSWCGAGLLTEQDAHDSLYAAARQRGIPAHEARATIKSGFTAGAANRSRRALPDDMGKVLPLRRPTGNAWMGDLTRGQNGPHATVSNALLVLGCDPELAGMVAYDEFAHRIIITKCPPTAHSDAEPPEGPYPREIADNDVTLIQGYVQRAYGMRISQPVTQQAVSAIADTNRVHPVRQWLEDLKWDGNERLATWLNQAFGCPIDDYHRAVGVKTLCAAVRRIFEPGCKFDYVLVLEGPQGRGKSRACRALFGAEWFTDNLSHDLSSKDAQQGMAGRWGLELAELNVLVRSSTQAAKAFFSRQVDYYRPPYGKTFVQRPRQCIFIGTTNESDWMSDTTGNRRYWPISCESVNVDWIEEWRYQLWAEAVVVNGDGEKLWLEDEAAAITALKHQETRMAEEVWSSVVWQYIEENQLHEVRVVDILHHALGLPRMQQDRRAEMRVARILKAEGWAVGVFREDKKIVRRWVAPEKGRNAVLEAF